MRNSRWSTVMCFKSWRRGLILAALFAMTACTSIPSGTTKTDKEIAALKQEVVTLQRQVALLNRRLNAISASRLSPHHPLARQSVSFAGNPALGNRQAKIAIVEFSDYQCPYCKRYHLQTFDLIRRKYVDVGQLLYVYRDYPLPSHRLAPAAAVAANCAGEQGGYWAMQRALFSRAARLDRTYYLAIAKKLKLDIRRFESCLVDRKQMDEVMRDTRYGASLGIRGTPAFFIGRIEGNSIVEATRVIGAQPMSVFTRAIDQALRLTQ
jgi:protein-disulfide isomerase